MVGVVAACGTVAVVLAMMVLSAAVAVVVEVVDVVVWVWVACAFTGAGRWPGWDSNPRPTDYESAALTG